MIDLRFYQVRGSLTAASLAAELGLEVVSGDASRPVTGLSSFANAGAGDLTYLADVRDAQTAGEGVVCFANTGAAEALPSSFTVIGSQRPKDAFAVGASMFAQRIELGGDGRFVAESAVVSSSAQLGPGVVLGEGAGIGSGSVIGPNSVIGPGVQIGRDCSVGPNVSIFCGLVGDRVAILAGARIGEGGFGVAHDSGRANLIPHFGRVILQDGVSIGANSCVDRGMLDDTIIGERTHIDNLCHIGHNVKIGAGCVMAAFGGVSGSVEVGDNVQFGGRAGLADHITVGSGARIAAGAAVLTSVPEGATYAGYPAKPSRTWMRELAWLARAAQKRKNDGS